jgi:hypothetical protein
MKWPGGVSYDDDPGHHSGGSVMTSDDAPDIDPIGRIALAFWREEQAAYHAGADAT